MCGRYYIDDETSREIEKILSELDKKKLGDKSYKTGEIFPTNIVPILVSQNDSIAPELCTRGFPNFQNKGVIINARSETAFEKKMFRESLVSRRCVIVSSGFFEWNKSKEKIFFTQPESDVMYMAGLYNTFQDEARFVILTTAANSSINDVHDRMPLILPQSQLNTWLFEPTQTQSILNQVPILLNSKSNFEQLGLDLN